MIPIHSASGATPRAGIRRDGSLTREAFLECRSPPGTARCPAHHPAAASASVRRSTAGSPRAAARFGTDRYRYFLDERAGGYAAKSPYPQLRHHCRVSLPGGIVAEIRAYSGAPVNRQHDVTRSDVPVCPAKTGRFAVRGATVGRPLFALAI